MAVRCSGHLWLLDYFPVSPISPHLAPQRGHFLWRWAHHHHSIQHTTFAGPPCVGLKKISNESDHLVHLGTVRSFLAPSSDEPIPSQLDTTCLTILPVRYEVKTNPQLTRPVWLKTEAGSPRYNLRLLLDRPFCRACPSPTLQRSPANSKGRTPKGYEGIHRNTRQIHWFTWNCTWNLNENQRPISHHVSDVKYFFMFKPPWFASPKG